MSDIPWSVVTLVDGGWLGVQCLICQAQRGKGAGGDKNKTKTNPETVKLSTVYKRKRLSFFFRHPSDSTTPSGLLWSLMKPGSNHQWVWASLVSFRTQISQQRNRKSAVGSWLYPTGILKKKKKTIINKCKKKKKMRLVVLQPGPVLATFAAVTVFSHMRPMFHQEQTLLQQDVHTGRGGDQDHWLTKNRECFWGRKKSEYQSALLIFSVSRLLFAQQQLKE